MSQSVHAITELAGTSSKSIDDAIRNAVETAGKSLRSLEWFEMISVRGQINDGSVEEFQVVVKVGFKYEGK